MRLRTIVIGVVVLFVALIATGVAILMSIDFNQYKGQIADAVKAATGRELTINGNFKLGLSLTPSVSVDDVSFANAPGGSRPNMLTLKHLAVQMELIPLLSQPVRVGFFSTTFIHDRRDDPLDAHHGVYTTVDLALAAGAFGSQTGFGRVIVQNSSYYQLTKSLVFARSTNFGMIQRYSGLPEIPLAERLFGILGVSGVFFGSDFITVTKSAGEWQQLKPVILGAIMEHFMSGAPLLATTALEATDGEEFFDESDAETVATIKELIETRVRPAVANDGGDITFRGFKDGVVYLNMKGSCAGCPSSTATLQHGIQNLLRHFIPDVTEVRPV